MCVDVCPQAAAPLTSISLSFHLNHTCLFEIKYPNSNSLICVLFIESIFSFQNE